jgi:hypothetical protein
MSATPVPPIHIRLTPADYAVCDAHISEGMRNRAPYYAGVYVLMLVALIVALVGFGNLFSFVSKVQSRHYWFVMTNVACLAAGVLLFFAMLVYARWSVGKLVFAQGSKLLVPYEFVAGPEGITIDSTLGRNLTRWQAIERMEIHGPHLYLYHLPNAALLVPQSAFASRSEFEGYAREVQALWQKMAA